MTAKDVFDGTNGDRYAWMRGSQHPRWAGGHNKLPERRAWLDMIRRCTNPKTVNYGDYGGRGIAVCPQWVKSFEKFLVDVGRRPSKKHSLDRYPNNDGNYEPGNVRWATSRQQLLNRRNNRILEVDGQSKTITEWAESSGLSPMTIHQRIKVGWPMKDAVTRAAGQSENHGIYSGRAVIVEVDGVQMSVANACRIAGLNPSTVYARIAQGFPRDSWLKKEARR